MSTPLSETPLGAPEPHGLAQELRATLRLAVPVVVVQLGMMAMGVVDTLMVGRVSAGALAAVALGNIYVTTVAMFASGVLFALDPVIAQAVGAGDHLAIARGVQRGMLLSVLLTIPSVLMLLPAAAVFRFFGQQPAIVPWAAAWTRIGTLSLLPFFVFVVMRQCLQAMHHLAPIVWTIVVANLLNTVLDWALIFGHLGFPAMGPVGSAWATAASRWAMALGLLAFAWRRLAPAALPLRRDALALRPLLRLFALGLPVGMQINLEYGVFALVGLIMGSLGAVQMAGHQVALNLASFTYQMPLGVSIASAILVGHAVGRGDMVEARRAARAGLIIGVGIMALNGIVLVTAPVLVARAYSSDPGVILVAATLIPLAGIFQVFDGTQVVSIGILRGTGDTRTPMVVNFIGYWLIGLPIAAWLGLKAGYGPRGLWWGLVAGLVVVAVILLARVRSRLSGHVRRVFIDH